MYETDKYLLKKLEHSDNKFQEVLKLSQQAKQLADAYDGQLFHSEAISAVVKHILPKYDYKACDDKLDVLIREMFCETEDSAVRDAVYDSLMLSRKKHYLIYVYTNIEHDSQKSRVRVLTNLLWYAAQDPLR